MGQKPSKGFYFFFPKIKFFLDLQWDLLSLKDLGTSGINATSAGCGCVEMKPEVPAVALQHEYN